MQALITPHNISGTFQIPGSKSHTIRRLLVAALADGVSEIEKPLDSLDPRSCAAVCRALGADIEERYEADPQNPNPPDLSGKKLAGWRVRGRGAGGFTPPARALDVGNSGTTLFLALAAAALGTEPVTFTGDEQIRRRSAGPLLTALAGLGITVRSAENGCAPITIQGPWKSGRVSLSCPTSQYLSALLLAAPLAPAGVVTEINVPLLNERPYIRMTLSYLDAQNIPYYGAPDFSRFRIPGGGSYTPVSGPVPADFSSAAFPGCAGVLGGSGPVTLLGLDPHDAQGDRFIFDILTRMGAKVEWRQIGESQWTVTVSRSGTLRGGVFDLNGTPDLLPIAAVLGAGAEGETALVNAAHARIKETDRVAVMAQELGKLGIRVHERPDGLVIHGGALQGGSVDGHKDHRVVMALAAAALGAAGPVAISGAEAADVTYPGFLSLLDAAVS